MSKSFASEFYLGGESTVLNSAYFTKVKNYLSAYFVNGLPDNVLNMSQKVLDEWFFDNKKKRYPVLYVNTLKPLDKISVGMAINCCIHESETICVEYECHDSVISNDGLSFFVFSVIEGLGHHAKFFVD